jgi:hypothetical protein
VHARELPAHAGFAVRGGRNCRECRCKDTAANAEPIALLRLPVPAASRTSAGWLLSLLHLLHLLRVSLLQLLRLLLVALLHLLRSHRIGVLFR